MQSQQPISPSSYSSNVGAWHTFSSDASKSRLHRPFAMLNCAAGSLIASDEETEIITTLQQIAYRVPVLNF